MSPALTAEITTRLLGPDEADDETRHSRLHQPVSQIEGTPKFKIRYEWFNSERAKEFLRTGEQADGFQQRKVRLSQVRRWRNLYNTNRFVHFLPNQPICYDLDGVPLNGQHRMAGLISAREGSEAGFMVIHGVPRWMFAFFDTNSVRSIDDVFHINSRPSKPQTKSAMRLAMRYEEFLLGLRAPTGWRHWPLVKDEHQDIDQYYARREEIQDWYGQGIQVYSNAKILIPSVMVFRFFQSLAWPDGDTEIQDFIDRLIDPMKATNQHPVTHLRRWSTGVAEMREHVPSKREVHLHLLFQTFAQEARGSRTQILKWAYGMPMAMPFHPKGHDVAVKNVRLALDEIDASTA